MGRNHGGGMPAPAEVVDLDQASALVDVRRRVANAHALDQRADRPAFRGDRLLVLRRGGESPIQQRSSALGTIGLVGRPIH